jgi:hypothetical protein
MSKVRPEEIPAPRGRPAPPGRPSDALFGAPTAVNDQPVVLNIQQNVMRSAYGEEETGFGFNSVFTQCPHCQYQVLYFYLIKKKK